MDMITDSIFKYNLLKYEEDTKENPIKLQNMF
jgi:hypothetical protein